MDPPYRAYLRSMGVIPPPPDSNNEENEDEYEESEEDDESGEETEEEEEDDEVLGDNRGSNVNSVSNGVVDTMYSGPSQEVVIVAAEDKDEKPASLNDREEVDGLFCPICFEAWTSGGDHHICCLPCGHIYGLSCIKKWLCRRGSSKCPQCKKKCGVKDIRLLYASRLLAVDGEMQKKVRYLEAKCSALEKKDADWVKKEAKWKKKEDELSKQFQDLDKRTQHLEDLLGNMKQKASSSSTWSVQGQSVLALGVTDLTKRCSNKFLVQKDFHIDGARLFDIDTTSKIFVIARRLSGMGGVHVLTKMSMLSDHEKEDVLLPDNTKAVKDLRVSPHDRLVLVASLGKKMSILSTESNNTIVSFNLPAAAWSCSWDICSPHYVYAGLQNGGVMLFDTRQTVRPVESLSGLSGNFIHSMQSLSPDSSVNAGNRSVLTASSVGLCQWKFGGSEERPYLIPKSDMQGVCISLAYCSISEHIVASYRPKVVTCGDSLSSQPTLTASSSSATGQAVRGTHVVYRRMDGVYRNLGATSANLSDIRFPKSSIMSGLCEKPVFASGDESSGELSLLELPSLTVVDRLIVRRHPIRDAKYTHALGSGLLCCLSDDSLQLYGSRQYLT